jgi:hypothetical protein
MTKEIEEKVKGLEEKLSKFDELIKLETEKISKLEK